MEFSERHSHRVRVTHGTTISTIESSDFVILNIPDSSVAGICFMSNTPVLTTVDNYDQLEKSAVTPKAIKFLREWKHAGGIICTNELIEKVIELTTKREAQRALIDFCEAQLSDMSSFPSLAEFMSS